MDTSAIGSELDAVDGDAGLAVEAGGDAGLTLETGSEAELAGVVTAGVVGVDVLDVCCVVTGVVVA